MNTLRLTDPKNHGRLSIQSAHDVAQQLSMQNKSYACIVRTGSNKYGVLEYHPFDVRVYGWDIQFIYCEGALVTE